MQNSLEKRKHELDSFEKSIEIKIFKEIEKNKFTTLKEIEDKKKLINMKLNLIEGEFSNVKAIRNNLDHLYKQKESLENENLSLIQ